MCVFIEAVQALYSPDEIFGGPLTFSGPASSHLTRLRRFSSRYGFSDALLSLRGLGLDLVDDCGPVKVNHFFTFLSYICIFTENVISSFFGVCITLVFFQRFFVEGAIKGRIQLPSFR